MVFFYDKNFVLSFQHQDKARKALGMQVDATMDGYTDQELFSLSSIKVSWFTSKFSVATFKCFMSFETFLVVII